MAMTCISTLTVVGIPKAVIKVKFEPYKVGYFLGGYSAGAAVLTAPEQELVLYRDTERHWLNDCAIDVVTMKASFPEIASRKQDSPAAFGVRPMLPVSYSPAS